MGISVGLVGLGQFGSAFADLFRAHPLVGRVALCDREPERMRAVAERPGWDAKLAPGDMYSDLDALLATDVDAVAIITQPWLHAPQCLRALESGKHVYSAVPVVMLPDGDEMLEWCGRIIDACTRTGLAYMLGETTYYRPEMMFCRRKAAEGAFGDFVHAEGEYFHDVDASCSLREVKRLRLDGRAGREWLEAKRRYDEAGAKHGPMHYPTHSVSGPVSVMGARAVRATAYGYANRTSDPYFEDHAFSNEVALFHMSNGATVRVCECREVAGAFHESETFRIMGTRGSYAERVWRENFRTLPGTARPLEVTSLTDDDMHDPLPEDVALAFARIGDPGASDPSDFTPRGHGGSHPYLVHEFVDAVAGERLPAVNAWEAARYMAMGVTAHKSALRDGETLEVPDFGDPPGAGG
ncbi:MAG: Gfo/Idh/MocA family oxidoreductase [Planctomycetota bacterium]|jgi:predicted dehydrogenase